MKLKRGSILLLVLIMVTLTIGQAFAGNMNDLKEKQSNIKDRMTTTQSELKSTQAEARNIKKEIQELDEQVSEATVELHNVTTQLEELNQDIIKTTEELKEAEENLALKIDEFYSRLRTMYKNGNSGYLEVLLSASDISDLLSRNHMLQQIADYDRELIAFIKEQKEVIEAKKAELEEQKAEVEVVKEQIEDHKAELEKATKEKESFMANLLEDIDTYEKEYDDLNKQADEITAQIKALQAKEAAERAARERAAAANATRQGQASRTGGNNNPSPAPSPNTGGRMAWPVPASSRVTSPFGYRIHPIYRDSRMHTGIDIAAPSGTAIVAADSGTVISSSYMGGYGNTVMIDHGGGMVTLYAHNSANLVSVGQAVSRGQTVALMGSTGNSTGPHLHFEVRQNGGYVNPLPWIR